MPAARSTQIRPDAQMAALIAATELAIGLGTESRSLLAR